MSEEYKHFDDGWGVSFCERSVYNPLLTKVEADVDCPSCIGKLQAKGKEWRLEMKYSIDEIKEYLETELHICSDVENIRLEGAIRNMDDKEDGIEAFCKAKANYQDCKNHPTCKHDRMDGCFVRQDTHLTSTNKGD